MRVGDATRTVVALATAVGALAALVPSAVAATSPVKPAVSGSAPAAIAPGRTVKITTTLKSTKARTIRVGLVLAVGTRATGGVALGTPRKVRLKAGKRLRTSISGRIAVGAFDARVGRLLVCVDPAKAIAGRAPTGACKLVPRAAGVAAIGDPVQLIDAALAAGRLTAVQARTYRLYAVVNSSRLPKVFRGRTVERTHSAIADLANNAASLPAATRAQAVRYFLPPTATGNAWIGKPGARSVTGRAEDPLACRGFDQLQSIADGGFNADYRRRWDAVASPDNHALVWYLRWEAKDPGNAFHRSEAAANTAKGRTSAVRYALAFPTIWSKLTPTFGTPQSDAGERCYHGPDGRYDIYVDVDYGAISASGPAGAIALTLPYPALGPYPVPGKWCTDRPAFTVIYPGLDIYVLAHEFMHAIQFAHRYKTCDEPVAFWDEGGANFAADMVYPNNQYEQRNFPYVLTDPVSVFSSARHADYEYWPFWMMLQRENGVGVLNNVFAQLQTKQAIDAVDAAIPGGFAKQIPRLGLTVWNQAPNGAAGFPVTADFRTWDRWNRRPPATRVPIALGQQPNGLFTIHVSNGTSMARNSSRPVLYPLSIGGMHEVVITDPNIKELKFRNALAGKPAHVDAMLHTVGGSWRLEDWTSKQEVVLCRDTPAENIDRIVLVSSNVSKTLELPAVTHTLEARKTCGYPKRFVGTFQSTVVVAGPGITQTYSYSGSVTLVRSPENLPFDLGPVSYDVDSGSLTWTFSQVNDDCTYSTGGNAAIDGKVSEGTGLVLEDTRLRAPPLTSPTPWRYSIVLIEAHPFDLVCSGITTMPPLYLEGMSVGSGLTTDDGAVKSATPTTLSGTLHEEAISPLGGGQTRDQTWSFTGFPQ